MSGHAKSSLVGVSSNSITDGRLNLGTWQGVYLMEFRNYRHTRYCLATINGAKFFKIYNCKYIIININHNINKHNKPSKISFPTIKTVLQKAATVKYLFKTMPLSQTQQLKPTTPLTPLTMQPTTIQIQSESNSEATSQPKPEPTQYNNGEVIVQKGSGLKKIRKGQSEESYIEQRSQFWSSGPLLNTESWLTDNLDILSLNNQFKKNINIKTSSDANIRSTKSDDKNDSPSITSDDQDGSTGEENSEFAFDKIDKIEREKIFRGLERLYFERKYQQCSKLVDELMGSMDLPEADELATKKKFKNLKRTVDELNEIRDNCLKKLKVSSGINSIASGTPECS
ncbi:unnamed protein product [Ambrosiozyma monospora]|uniref:Unnamed protein product n=1 Tax=Ambrosiozyma monospora TaxID=43982 RepID=A0ACB5TAB8_AMBMO|nr:unnamed protein product [Ambrosiozyma monospora]